MTQRGPIEARNISHRHQVLPLGALVALKKLLGEVLDGRIGHSTHIVDAPEQTSSLCIRSGNYTARAHRSFKKQMAQIGSRLFTNDESGYGLDGAGDVFKDTEHACARA